ncbi:hypothetical protein [Streptacidiphilus sp. PAMC 29251]
MTVTAATTAGAAPPAPAPAHAPGPGATAPRTPAPRRLRRVLVALVLCTAALWGTLEFALGGAHSAVSAAESRAVPAIVDTSQVAYYLADADRVAAGSFASGTVRLSGPGQRYQDDLKSANQALERAAQDDATGSAGSAQLQSIEGLLVEYTSRIEQAHAAQGQGALGSAYLSYASSLMHDPATGILAEVTQLQAADQQQLLRQRHSGWLSAAALIGVLVPAPVALVLLIGTQRFLSRHFQRRLNPCLLAASLLLTALVGWTVGETLHSDHAFSAATGTELPRLTDSWQARTLVWEASGSDALALVRTTQGQAFSSGFAGFSSPLAALLDRDPGTAAAHPEQPDATVRAHLQRFTAADAELRQQAAAHSPGTVATAVGPGPTQLVGAATALDADLAPVTGLHQQRLTAAEVSARSDLGLGTALPLLCAAIAALCLGGLWPRIDEYRAAR